LSHCCRSLCPSSWQPIERQKSTYAREDDDPPTGFAVTDCLAAGYLIGSASRARPRTKAYTATNARNTATNFTTTTAANPTTASASNPATTCTDATTANGCTTDTYHDASPAYSAAHRPEPDEGCNYHLIADADRYSHLDTNC
jgi:hypothetical protein